MMRRGATFTFKLPLEWILDTDCGKQKYIQTVITPACIKFVNKILQAVYLPNEMGNFDREAEGSNFVEWGDNPNNFQLH